MTSGPNVKTSQVALLRDDRQRITLVERRVATRGVPARLGPRGAASLDLNDEFQTGWYVGVGGTTANTPRATGVWEVTVRGLWEDGSTPPADTYATQDAFKLDEPNIRYRRRYDDTLGAWTAWKRVDTLPDPLTQVLNGSTGTTITGTAWMDVVGMAGVTFGALDTDLYVRCEGAAQLSANATAYSMIGIDASGGITLGPEEGQSWQGGGLSQFGFTAFGNITTSQKYNCTKDLLIPAGTAVTIKLRCKRNVASGSNGLSYPALQVTPLKWAD